MTSSRTRSEEVSDFVTKSAPDFVNTRKYEVRPSKPISITVPCAGNRRQAMRDALAQLPRGDTLDVVIRHDEGCFSLYDSGELADCSCPTVTLEARQIPPNGGGLQGEPTAPATSPESREKNVPRVGGRAINGQRDDRLTPPQSFFSLRRLGGAGMVGGQRW
jgi:hypothetical protein